MQATINETTPQNNQREVKNFSYSRPSDPFYQRFTHIHEPDLSNLKIKSCKDGGSEVWDGKDYGYELAE